jgi:putative ABC transport system permease protein
VKWALVIAAAGAVAGVAAGAQLGAAIISLYNQYFRFPLLDYHLSWGVAVASVVSSLVVAALGAMTAVRRAVRIPPAEAMRPEPPARYGPSLIERLKLARLTPATQMILRNLERQPTRSAMSILGVAFAVGVLFVGLSLST